MSHAPPTDEQLLLASRRDADAFVLRPARARLAQWLRRRTDPDTARDRLAETWAEAWRCPRACARR